MVTNKFLFLFILMIIFNQSSQQYLSLTPHQTSKYQLKTGTWKDLLGITVECPHKGILKNFVLKKDSQNLWYEFECYSSIVDGIDEGEPIIKGVTLRSSYKNTIKIQENISNLNDFPVECWVDYGLMSFKIYNDNGVLKREAVCHGLKPKYTSKLEFQTGKVTALATRIDGLVGITVGSTAKEDNNNIAYPLRGFKYSINTSSSKQKPTVSYIYGYSILRNMQKVKEDAKVAFENLRNGNTQKN